MFNYMSSGDFILTVILEQELVFSTQEPEILWHAVRMEELGRGLMAD